MQRKLMQQGGTSLVISLPKAWTIQHQLKAGDALELNANDDSLSVTLPHEQQYKRYVLSTTNLDRSTLYLKLLTLYQQGYDEVKVIFEGKIPDHERNQPQDVIKKIKSWMPRFLGWEIMQQDEHSSLIKEVTGPSAEEPKNFLRRVFFLLNSFLQTESEAWENNRWEEVQVLDFYETATKLINVAIRTINKKPLTSETMHQLLQLNSLHRLAGLVKKTHPLLKRKHALLMQEVHQHFSLIVQASFAENPDLPALMQQRLHMKKKFEEATLQPLLKHHLLAVQETLKEIVYGMEAGR